MCTVSLGLRKKYAPKRRRGVIVNLFIDSDEADSRNDGRILLLRTIGETFCEILSDKLETMPDKVNKTREASRFQTKAWLSRPIVLNNG